MDMSGSILQAQRIACTLGKQVAVHNMSIDVVAGRITALVGHNGAGKSTFLRILAGLQSPDVGELTVCGVDAIAHRDVLHQHVGWVPSVLTDDYSNLTTHEIIRLFAAAHFLDPSQTATHIDRLVRQLHIERFTEHFARDLPPLVAYKVSIARALVHSPHLLLLDELPQRSCPEETIGLWRFLRSLARENVGIVFTATSFEGLADWADDFVVVEEGVTVATGSGASTSRSPS